jgi:hypothetical protein
MRLTNLLRAGAMLLAAAGVFDPAWTINRTSPLPIAVRTADIADDRVADDVRRRLRELNDVAVDAATDPAAVVVVGAASMPNLPAGISVSLVRRATGPNVIVDALAVPRVSLPGLTGRIEATLTAVGMAGTTSRIALELDGIELASVEHRWAADTETYTAWFDHVPPAAGVGVVRVAARPVDREIAVDDNYVDRQVIVEDRRVRVLVHEPRPSWTTTFIRRVLEADPLFEPAGLTRPSRGIAASVGAAPAQISATALARFDVVIVGAPEELHRREVAALEEFSTTRGGTVVFVPDRHPSGAYTVRLPITRFDEALLQTPTALQGIAPPMKGSEFITIPDPPPGVDTVAALPRQVDSALSERSESQGVIVSWPAGAGRIVFSGALDAWRYRTEGDGFARFWKAQIAQAGVRSPPPIEIELDGAPATSGDIVTVRARVRPTEFAAGAATIELPRVAGRVVAADGSVSPVRLWPGAETGVFQGGFAAPQPGRHVVEVTAGAVSASQPLIVAAGSRRPHPASPASLGQLASATGGIVVSPSDLSPLERLLAGLPRPAAAATIHPARSSAWTVAFIALLTAEWWLRRRRGHA